MFGFKGVFIKFSQELLRFLRELYKKKHLNKQIMKNLKNGSVIVLNTAFWFLLLGFGFEAVGQSIAEIPVFQFNNFTLLGWVIQSLWWIFSFAAAVRIGIWMTEND